MGRRARIVVPLALAAVLLGGLAWSFRGGSAPQSTAPDDDVRAPLRRETIDGEPWLVHPTLRFRLSDPGAAFALEHGAPTAGTGAASWLYRAPDGAAVSILLNAVPHNTREAFYSYVDGQKRGIQGEGAAIDQVRAEYFAGRGRCVIAARLGAERIVAATYVFQTGRVPRAWRVSVSAGEAQGDAARGFVAPR